MNRSNEASKMRLFVPISKCIFDLGKKAPKVVPKIQTFLELDRLQLTIQFFWLKLFLVHFLPGHICIDDIRIKRIFFHLIRHT
jgi:hypothetical protein